MTPELDLMSKISKLQIPRKYSDGTLSAISLYSMDTTTLSLSLSLFTNTTSTYSLLSRRTPELHFYPLDFNQTRNLSFLKVLNMIGNQKSSTFTPLNLIPELGALLILFIPTYFFYLQNVCYKPQPKPKPSQPSPIHGQAKRPNQIWLRFSV